MTAILSFFVLLDRKLPKLLNKSSLVHDNNTRRCIDRAKLSTLLFEVDGSHENNVFKEFSYQRLSLLMALLMIFFLVAWFDGRRRHTVDR